MPKIVIMMDGVADQEIALTQERTTLGRRASNDIVLDHPAVSGQHAVLMLHAGQVQVEDLGSTNGTYVNGAAVHKQTLADGDQLEMGTFKLRLQIEAPQREPEAKIRVLSGTGMGRELLLNKPISTLGKPGVAVAVITCRAQQYWLHQQDGPAVLMLNGVPIGADPVRLRPGDDILLAGVSLQFVQS